MGQEVICLSENKGTFILAYTWGENIHWQTNAGNIVSGQGSDEIIIQYEGYGRKYIQVIESDQSGCIDTSFIELELINCEPEFFIPNAFSPNADGLNDFFQPVAHHFIPKSYSMKIYNRWGDLVFKSVDIDRVWWGNSERSGQPVPDGVYVYLIEAYDQYGEFVKAKGRITLIR